MDSLYKLLDIELNRKEMICIVGAGGKTTTMFHLARELTSRGKSVLVTTTTAIYYPEKSQFDRLIITEEETLELFESTGANITVLGKPHTVEGKLSGISPLFLDTVFSKGIFDFILIEGDGSKGRPIKAPADHEPVIPSSTTRVLGVIGLDSIGKPVCEENVHRPDIFCQVTGCNKGDNIDSGMIARLAEHEQGLFKAVPEHAERCLLLNKADEEQERLEAANIVKCMSDSGCAPEIIVISSFNKLYFDKTAMGSAKGK